jgi:hypothetical protein
VRKIETHNADLAIRDSDSIALMSIQIKAKTGQDEHHDGDVKLMPDIHECFHMLAELDADSGQEVAPDQRANKREGAEHGEVSSQHPGGERNEGSYNRQHSAYQEELARRMASNWRRSLRQGSKRLLADRTAWSTFCHNANFLGLFPNDRAQNLVEMTCVSGELNLFRSLKDDSMNVAQSISLVRSEDTA